MKKQKDAFFVPLIGGLLWFGNYHHLLKALHRYDTTYWLDCYLGAFVVAFFLRDVINEKRTQEFKINYQVTDNNNKIYVPISIKESLVLYFKAVIEMLKKWVFGFVILSFAVIGQG